MVVAARICAASWSSGEAHYPLHRPLCSSPLLVPRWTRQRRLQRDERSETIGTFTTALLRKETALSELGCREQTAIFFRPRSHLTSVPFAIADYAPRGGAHASPPAHPSRRVPELTSSQSPRRAIR